jgi:hypothetical protein
MEEGGFGTAIYKTQPKIAQRQRPANKNATDKQIIISFS